MQEMLQILQNMSMILGRDWKNQKSLFESFLEFYVSCLTYFQGNLFINADILHFNLWNAFENMRGGSLSLQSIFTKAFDQVTRFYPIPLFLYSRISYFIESKYLEECQDDLKVCISIVFNRN